MSKRDTQNNKLYTYYIIILYATQMTAFCIVNLKSFLVLLYKLIFLFFFF